MIRLLALAVALTAATATPAFASSRLEHAPKFLRGLDRDGSASAGWVNVLPGLATACNFRLDNQELTEKLVDLSRQSGNASYTRDLYTTLYDIENHRRKNTFVKAWTVRFDGRQKEACAMAEALWGDEGHQFRGVLKREAANVSDGSVLPPGTAPANCR